MRILYRFGFNQNHTKLLEFLDKSRVPYTVDGIIAYTEMYADESSFRAVFERMKNEQAVITDRAIFTEEELETAEWLAVSSEWVTQYPEPKENMDYVYQTYDTASYCAGRPPKFYCRQGLTQKADFVVKKAPNWSTRAFCRLNWVGDELFLSDKAKEKLSESGLKGFSFRPVLKPSHVPHGNLKTVHAPHGNLNTGDEPHADFSQLFIENIAEIGLSASSVQHEYVCPDCGRKKVMLNSGFLEVTSENLRNAAADIVKSAEKIGGIGCDSLILISARFFRFLRENRLDSGLVFTPVKF